MRKSEEVADNKEVSDPAYELGAVLCVEVEEDVDAVEYIETTPGLEVYVEGSELHTIALA